MNRRSQGKIDLPIDESFRDIDEDLKELLTNTGVYSVIWRAAHDTSSQLRKDRDGARTAADKLKQDVIAIANRLWELERVLAAADTPASPLSPLIDGLLDDAVQRGIEWMDLDGVHWTPQWRQMADVKEPIERDDLSVPTVLSTLVPVIRIDGEIAQRGLVILGQPSK